MDGNCLLVITKGVRTSTTGVVGNSAIIGEVVVVMVTRLSRVKLGTSMTKLTGVQQVVRQFIAIWLLLLKERGDRCSAEVVPSLRSPQN